MQSKEKEPGPYNFHPLLHACHLVEERLRTELSPLGVRPRQARLLDALNELESASQVDLARMFDISPASMSTMTGRLIKAGLINREPDERELRSNRLSLTDKGRDQLKSIYQAWSKMDELLVEALGEEKSETLAANALELRNALGGRAPFSQEVESM